MSSQQQQSTQYQRQTLEQASGDKSLPSYRDATKGQSPVDVTEKEIEIESVKKQSKLSALKSMFKEKPGSSAGPSGKFLLALEKYKATILIDPRQAIQLHRIEEWRRG